MIASIHGLLEARRAGYAIIRVGGFSIRIFAPTSTLSRLGDVGAEVMLYTHFHVREDGMALYGFSSEEDRERLALAPGVGKRLAAKLVLELKGKLPSLVSLGGADALSPSGKIQSEALEALMGLGFSAAEAQAALAKIPQDRPMTLEEQITLALRSFAREP